MRQRSTLAILVATLLLAGFGCSKATDAPAPAAPATEQPTTAAPAGQGAPAAAGTPVAPGAVEYLQVRPEDKAALEKAKASQAVVPIEPGEPASSGNGAAD